MNLDEIKVKVIPWALTLNLKGKLEDYEIYLFGSYAKGTANKDSDIDIAIKFLNMPFNGNANCDSEQEQFVWEFEGKKWENDLSEIIGIKSHIQPYEEIFREAILLFSTRQLKEADFLFHAAKVNAITFTDVLFKKMPELQYLIENNLYNFLLSLITIAGVGIAFMEICDSLPEEDQAGICYSIKKILNNWQQHSFDFMTNFAIYVKTDMDLGVDISKAIGGWILTTMAGHENSSSKVKKITSSLDAADLIGLPLLITFHNWWTNEK